MTIFNRALLITLALLISHSVSAQNFRYFLRKANKEYELKAFNLAVDSYQQALAKRPNNAEALGKMADCLRHLNRMEEAATKYAEALSQNNFERSHVLQFGQVLKALGRYDEAKQWFEEYQKDNPTIGNHYAQTCDYAKIQQNANTGFFAINASVNSTASDFGPAYYNTQLVYSSASLDLQRSNINWTGKNDNQLFVASVNTDGSLREPKFLRNEQADVYNQGPVAFSPDGKLVAYTKNNFTDGTRQIPSSGLQLSIFLAEVTPTGEWVNEMPFTHNGQDFSAGYPHFSSDGSAMFFSSDRPGGYGGFDLYVCYRSGQAWSRPINLGAVVNTQGNEIAPYFDGTQLFFSSDWHAGLGGMDIFRAEQESGRWNKVFHLGVPINSGYDDYGLIFDSFQERGYFTSNRPGGKGSEDIYRITRNASSSALAIIRVRNASDGTPIANAMLDFSACGLGTYFADNEGIYKFPLKNSAFDCEVIVNRDGYNQEVVRISQNMLNSQPELTIYLNPTNPIGGGQGLNTQYVGTIVDYNSRRPLSGVSVTAIDQTAGGSTQAFTDNAGKYALSLSSNKTYFITFKGRGYQEVSKVVNTFGTYDQNLLGTITLFPDGTALPPVDQDPNNNPTNIASGFSIQVAALSKDNVSSFENLASYGNVYSKLENGKYKIRVGVFNSKQEAQAALNNIKRAGNPSAFIVTESGVNLDSRGGQPSTGIQPQPPTQQPPTPGVSTAGYKIQLGAYRNVSSFDSSKIQGLGYVEERMKGDLTLKLLAGFPTLDAAKRALPSVQSAGFKGAFIVLDQNGSLTRVRN
jgi:tetratricopeptide (TPR) repeat protein